MSRAIYLLSPVPKEGTIALPMIDFRITAKSIDFSHIDTLMFTSKQAVVTADKIDPSWKNYPCIAIGSATKKQIEELGGKVIYHPGSFYGEVLSQDIAEFFRDRKLLYLRPKEISFDSKGFLEKEGITLQEQTIYETFCIKYSPDRKPSKDAVIIFTSPSTIHCFLKSFEWDESYMAVVIGRSTKVHLPKNAVYTIADTPLISSCIEKAKEILLTSNSK
ncbi:MAG: uroporphyrinogen-III synthase [Epsilonproteobacteria bacterium (ex Lamellibrachia satsuma)]|nr:MAG: uroporphyrinogen-III synthase [Epsilonproteobacteria bacterium (ex Lamellibrachia satsuma)]